MNITGCKLRLCPLSESHIRRLRGLEFGLSICRSFNDIVKQVAFKKIQNQPTRDYL